MLSLISPPLPSYRFCHSDETAYTKIRGDFTVKTKYLKFLSVFVAVIIAFSCFTVFADVTEPYVARSSIDYGFLNYSIPYIEKTNGQIYGYAREFSPFFYQFGNSLDNVTDTTDNYYSYCASAILFPDLEQKLINNTTYLAVFGLSFSKPVYKATFRIFLGEGAAFETTPVSFYSYGSDSLNPWFQVKQLRYCLVSIYNIENPVKLFYNFKIGNADLSSIGINISLAELVYADGTSAQFSNDDANTNKIISSIDSNTNKITAYENSNKDSIISNADDNTNKITSNQNSNTNTITSNADNNADKITSKIHADTDRTIANQNSNTDSITSNADANADKITSKIHADTDRTLANQNSNTNKVLDAGSDTNQPDFAGTNNQLDSTTAQMNALEGQYKIDPTSTTAELNKGTAFISGSDMNKASIQVKTWIERFSSENTVISGFLVAALCLGLCFWVIGRKAASG